MKYYLDTNICIYFLKGSFSALLGQLRTKTPDDLILAATVLANDGILVTNNEVEFKRVKKLNMENWTK